MPPGVGQAIQNAAQDILALAVLVVGILGIGAIISERARKLLLDRVAGGIYARVTRRRARSERIEQAVTAVSHGLMLKATTGDWAGSQEQAMEALHAQQDALAGVTILKTEYPTEVAHLDEVIKFLTGKRIEIDAVAVSQRLIQPILDATQNDVADAWRIAIPRTGVSRSKARDRRSHLCLFNRLAISSLDPI
jgi:hypothetical protein